LIEAVHCARAQLVVTQGIRVSINVVANGYHLQFGDMINATELFLGTNCIWRVCQGLLRITDFIRPSNPIDPTMINSWHRRNQQRDRNEGRSGGDLLPRDALWRRRLLRRRSERRRRCNRNKIA
jgi:hypothetical protein